MQEFSLPQYFVDMLKVEVPINAPSSWEAAQYIKDGPPTRAPKR